jgi:hypothetical protein
MGLVVRRFGRREGFIHCGGFDVGHLGTMIAIKDGALCELS